MSGTKTASLTVTTQPAPAAPKLTLSTGTQSPSRVASIAAIIAGQWTAPTQQAGIISGPGNQGTANVAQLAGQSGTAGVQISMPRHLQFGQGWER